MSYIYIEHLFLMFLDHRRRCSTVGRSPLDEWSARRRDLYLTTHDTHNRQISMPPVGFEPTISAGERPVAAHLLRSWVRIPPGSWIFVCCECRVLSGRGLCDELTARPEESYRLWCVVVCDLETSRIGAPYIYMTLIAWGLNWWICVAFVLKVFIVSIELLKSGSCYFGIMYSGTMLGNDSLKSGNCIWSHGQRNIPMWVTDWFCSRNLTEMVTIFVFVTTVLYRCVLRDSTNQRSRSKEQLVLTHLY